MAGFPMIAIEVSDGYAVLYLSTHPYYTLPADAPANVSFQPRLVEDVSFERSVGCVLWGTKSRGEQSFGVIRIANADGAFDSYVGASLRDEPLIIKRGNSLDAYSTFTVVASLLIDRVEFADELVMAIYVTDITAKLERSLQTAVYPATVTNQTLRQQPRPITFGRCYQVPMIQPNVYGNGRYDLHDNDNWIGVEQVMDRGATLTEGGGYERATVTGIYGIERLTALQGKQCATTLGAFKVDSTEVTEDFANLTSWTETNGGVGGRDVSIVASAARILNTLGGADLSIAWNASTPTGTDATFWFYEFNCTAWVSGYAQFRTETTAIQRVIDAGGRYTGIIRAAGNVVPAFYAPATSNADLTIDSFRLRKVTPMERLLDCVKFLATSDATVGGHGPLALADVDTATLAALESEALYSLGWYAQDPVQIADVLDQVMASFAGWWYVDKDGLLTVGRLLAPTGTPVLEFDSSNIADGMRVEFDEAKGLSNRALGKRNWQPYDDGDLVDSLQYVQLNAFDTDADIAISGNGFTYTATGVGSVRSTPLIYGDRYFVVVTPATIGGGDHRVGVGSVSAAITSAPGVGVDSIAYRSDGTSYINGVNAAYGSPYIAGAKIGIAYDGRSAAMGSRTRGFRVYFSEDGTWQAASDPDAETGFLSSALNAKAIAYAMVGANATGNSGTINFGEVDFTYPPPDDYIAPAWHRTKVTAVYRDQYQSAVALAIPYAFADASEAPVITLTADVDADVTYLGGIGTLLNRYADLSAECDRWCTMYASERFFYTFDAFIDALAADGLSPGDLISVSYPRFGLADKLLRVIGVKGRMLDRRVTIRAWG